MRFVGVLAAALLAWSCGTHSEERSAELPTAAARVLAANAGSLDVVLDVGGEARLAGAVRSTLPWSAALHGRRVGAQSFDEALGGATVLAGFDVEEIVELAPDLIVAHAWQTRPKEAQLARLGVPVLELAEAAGLGVEATWDALVRDLGEVGAALGAEERAAEIVQDLDRRLAALEAGDRSDVRVLTYSDGGGGGYTAGSGTTFHAMIAWAGATSAAVEAGLESHTAIDLERLLAIDPDVLVVPAANAAGGTSATLALLEGDPRARELRAFGEGTVIVLPAHLYSATSHYVLDAAEAVAAGIDAWRGAAEEE